MPGPDQKTVVQHEWVCNEWEEEDGSISAEYYCEECYREYNHDAPADEEFYSVCPEYDGDDDGENAQATDSG